MVIIDAGPLVAIFDISEPLHEICKETMAKLRSPLVTTWPVLTEAFYLLKGWDVGQGELWDFILRGGVRVAEISEDLYPRMNELMKKYADNPMDIADASIVAVSEMFRIKTVFTLDRRDFESYRPRHCRHFEIIP